MNESFALEFIWLLLFVSDVFDIGMVGLRAHPYLACSSDSVAFVNVDEVVNF